MTVDMECVLLRKAGSSSSRLKAKAHDNYKILAQIEVFSVI